MIKMFEIKELDRLVEEVNKIGSNMKNKCVMKYTTFRNHTITISIYCEDSIERHLEFKRDTSEIDMNVLYKKAIFILAEMADFKIKKSCVNIFRKDKDYLNSLGSTNTNNKKILNSLNYYAYFEDGKFMNIRFDPIKLTTTLLLYGNGTKPIRIKRYNYIETNSIYCDYNHNTFYVVKFNVR